MYDSQNGNNPKDLRLELRLPLLHRVCTDFFCLKSVFPESNTFSKTIRGFFERFTVIILSDQSASIKLQEIQQENGKFSFETVLLPEYTNFKICEIYQ